ncbi:unnamed protein product, partial [Trichobilharzia regenti]
TNITKNNSRAESYSRRHVNSNKNHTTGQASTNSRDSSLAVPRSKKATRNRLKSPQNNRLSSSSTALNSQSSGGGGAGGAGSGGATQIR